MSSAAVRRLPAQPRQILGVRAIFLDARDQKAVLTRLFASGR